MEYTITQQLNQYPTTENGWDDDITATAQPNTFIAVTANEIKEGASQRDMTVTLFTFDGMPSQNHTNSGLYIRQDGEKSVKATLVDQDGKELASNVTNYPD